MTREEFLKNLPELAKGFTPAQDVIQHISGVSLLMLIGPSGVGKSTLVELSGFGFVPSDTTRGIRPGEKEGVDMYFRKDYDGVVNDVKNGRFVQIAIFANGDLYATKDTSYPASGVAIMPVMADVIPIFRNLGFKETISAFVAPPSYEEWMHRIKEHGLSDEQIAKRLPEAIRSFNFALKDSSTHLILNDNLEKAVHQTRELAGGIVDSAREAAARQAAQDILSRLE